MKPSGIEWIGYIPDDWEVKRVKNTGKLIGGSAFPDEYQGVKNEEIPFIKVKSLAEDPISRNGKDSISESIRSKLNAEKFIIGSVVFAKVGAALLLQRFRILEFESCIDNNMMGFIPLVIEPRFFKYVTVLFDFSYFVNPGTVPSINQEQIGNIKIPFPPLKTQQKIADYLDEKCGEIDATISKQKESIEKLKAYKQSLISETVTKGLDKSAPLKPSGIEWIGDIPAHWGVKRIKELFSFGKGLPISKEDLIENGIPVINYGQIHSKDNNGTSIKDSLIRYVDLNYKNTNMTSLVESGDFIFADTSEDLDGCGNCIYVDSKYPIFAGYHCIILRSIKRNSSKYLAYLFQMDAWRTQIRRDVTGVKVFSISKKILGKSYILLPPRYEQECIVNYLQEKCNEIDIIINKKQNIIQKLDAYKKSLIFECVTGKQEI